jgi:hypothetical protein
LIDPFATGNQAATIHTLDAKPSIFKSEKHTRRMTMAVVNIGHYYAEWMPSGSPDS